MKKLRLKERVENLEQRHDSLRKAFLKRMKDAEHPPRFKDLDQIKIRNRKGKWTVIYSMSARTCAGDHTWKYSLVNNKTREKEYIFEAQLKAI